MEARALCEQIRPEMHQHVVGKAGKQPNKTSPSAKVVDTSRRSYMLSLFMNKCCHCLFFFLFLCLILLLYFIVVVFVTCKPVWKGKARS